MKNIHYASLEIHDVSYKNETEKNLEKKQQNLLLILSSKNPMLMYVYIYIECF